MARDRGFKLRKHVRAIACRKATRFRVRNKNRAGHKALTHAVDGHCVAMRVLTSSSWAADGPALGLAHRDEEANDIRPACYMFFSMPRKMLSNIMKAPREQTLPVRKIFGPFRGQRCENHSRVTQ